METHGGNQHFIDNKPLLHLPTLISTSCHKLGNVVPWKHASSSPLQPLSQPLLPFIVRTHSPTPRGTEEPPVGGQDDTHGEEGTLWCERACFAFLPHEQQTKNRLFALTDDCWTDVGCVAAAALRALDFYAIFPFCLAVLLLFFHPVGFWLQLSSSVLGGELHSLTFVGRPLGCSFCSQMLLLSAWSTQSIQHTRSERV